MRTSVVRARENIPAASGHPLVGVLPEFQHNALNTLLRATHEHGDAVNRPGPTEVYAP